MEMNMKKFEDFFEHDNLEIRVAARFLAKVQEKYEAKEISKSEFEELAADALEINEVSGLSDQLDQKIMVSEALSVLKMIAKFIPV